MVAEHLLISTIFYTTNRILKFVSPKIRKDLATQKNAKHPVTEIGAADVFWVAAQRSHRCLQRRDGHLLGVLRWQRAAGHRLGAGRVSDRQKAAGRYSKRTKMVHWYGGWYFKIKHLGWCLPLENCDSWNAQSRRGGNAQLPWAGKLKRLPTAAVWAVRFQMFVGFSNCHFFTSHFAAARSSFGSCLVISVIWLFIGLYVMRS